MRETYTMSFKEKGTFASLLQPFRTNYLSFQDLGPEKYKFVKKKSKIEAASISEVPWCQDHLKEPPLGKEHYPQQKSTSIKRPFP